MAKILIVDDDTWQREVYMEVFRNDKFEVTTAINGDEALEKFKTEKPDGVFTGIMMPGMDGYELAAKIRELSPKMPIIIFSHLGKPEDHAKANKAGIEFMVKGKDGPGKILQKMKELLAAVQK